MTDKRSAKKTVRDIRRTTQRHYSKSLIQRFHPNKAVAALRSRFLTRKELLKNPLKTRN